MARQIYVTIQYWIDLRSTLLLLNIIFESNYYNLKREKELKIVL